MRAVSRLAAAAAGVAAVLCVATARPAAACSADFLAFFAPGGAELSSRARLILAEGAGHFRRTREPRPLPPGMVRWPCEPDGTQPRERLEVRGHADDGGDPAADLALSVRRAEAVAAELMRLGVEPSRLRIVAVGAAEPMMASPASEEDRAFNRRAALHMR